MSRLVAADTSCTRLGGHSNRNAALTVAHDPLWVASSASHQASATLSASNDVEKWAIFWASGVVVDHVRSRRLSQDPGFSESVSSPEKKGKSVGMGMCTIGGGCLFVGVFGRVTRVSSSEESESVVLMVVVVSDDD